MKKSALTFGALLVMVAPITTAIACGSAAQDPLFVLALDGHDHSHLDKSFNEQAFLGLKDFGKNPVVAKPTETNDTAFQQLYANAASGATIVAPGLLHQSALDRVTDEIDGKEVILLDASVANDKVASVEFRVEQAAFLGGYALAEYLDKNDGDFNDDSEIKVSAFGGSDVPTITGFMGGFQLGIEHYNTAGGGTNVIEFVKLADRAAHFSGGFAPGGGITLATTLLVTEAVDVLLPVAGPQTGDALAVIADNSLSTKIVGVDAAQEELYAGDSENFLFSILKDLRTATTEMLKLIVNEDTSVDSSYKGLGQTTWGDLTNGLIGISGHTTSLKNYFDIALADSVLKAAAESVDPAYFFDGIS